MAVLYVEGKPVTLDDEIVRAGDEAIRAALAIDIPGVESMHIEIEQPAHEGAPVVVKTAKRDMPKGAAQFAEQLAEQLAPYDHVVARLADAPAYINPAILLAAQVLRAEAEGDTEFIERAARAGLVERAVAEGSREGRDCHTAMRNLGHVVPCASVTVPVGF